MQVVDKANLVQGSMVGQIKREISILRRLHHPNIVDLKEVMASQDKLYMVMELVPGGELFDQVVANGPFKVKTGAIPTHALSLRLHVHLHPYSQQVWGHGLVAVPLDGRTPNSVVWHHFLYGCSMLQVE